MSHESDGELSPCPKSRRPRTTGGRTWFAVAACLIVAVALVLVAAALGATSFTQTSVRSRLEYVAQSGASVSMAAFVLAAVVALFQLGPEHAARARPVLVGAMLVGGVIVLLTAFSIFDVLTVHIPGPNSQDTISFALTRGESFDARLAELLHEVAALLIALVAMVGANRLGDFVSGSRGNGDAPPG